MPESLVPANEKGQLRAQAAEANALQRPQAVPMVPLPVTVPGSEKPSAPVEQQGPVQPTATPTAAPPSTVIPPSGSWPREPVGPLPAPVHLQTAPVAFPTIVTMYHLKNSR